MNRLQALVNREYGYTNTLDYDFALGRLAVAKEDSWRGIQPRYDTADFNPEPPIFAAKFANCNRYRHLLALANENGDIGLQDVTKRNDKPEEQSLTALHCHLNAVFDVEWMPNEMNFLTASGDHSVRLWQISNNSMHQLRAFYGHTRSVKTLAFRPRDMHVFATGGRDGAIMIWDTRAHPNNCVGDYENCIQYGHVERQTRLSKRRLKRPFSKKNIYLPEIVSTSVTGLVFQNENMLISCGASDGLIKVWDLRRNYTVFKREVYPKYTLPYAGTSTFKGFTNLLVDASGSRLYANCMDHNIYCYNINSYAKEPILKYKGLVNSTFYIKACLSPDGKYLLSGSSDENAYIWNLNYPDEPIVKLAGHSVEVTCVAWGCTHDNPIVTCSDEARHKIWRIGPEKLSDFEKKENYCGHAEIVHKIQPRIKINYDFLDKVSTPRTLKRPLIPNERTTPVSTYKKRTFRNILTDSLTEETEDVVFEEVNEYQDIKRPRLLEPRARRLFTVVNPAQTSSIYTPSADTTVTAENEELSTTCEPTTPLKNAHANKINNCSNSDSEISNIYSPTSNLPNYVLNGEAPHMAAMSPKRQVKRKVDWLTKIRKQKLMCTRRNGILCEKISNEELDDLAQKDEIAENLENSLHFKPLCAAECSPRLLATPRRRRSQDSLRATSRTPSSSRRSCENTLLKFFSKQTQKPATIEETSEMTDTVTTTATQLSPTNINPTEIHAIADTAQLNNQT